MEDKKCGDKIDDDEMLPGFRFHPTEEELVGFYLKRKIQQLSIPIVLIKQMDIYKHDPWDLPSKIIAINILLCIMWLILFKLNSFFFT